MEYPLEEQVGLVINSVDNKRMGIQPEAIERAMMPALAHIPLDERSALRAANYGVPIVTQNTKSPIGQAIISLAELVREKLSQAEAESDQEKSQRAGRGRLL
jgi:MinD-like ATPase involved in chromosome partitioning or flagellar assembly